MLGGLWKGAEDRIGTGQGWLLLISRGHGLASFILGLVLFSSQLYSPCSVSPPSLPIRSGSPNVEDGQALAQLLPGRLGAPEPGEVEPSPQPVHLSGDPHGQQLKHESSTSAPQALNGWSCPV